jgi:hypothetical protein
LPSAFSYPFTPYQENGTTILRPMLMVTLSKGQEEFSTNLLIDSGADFSLLRREVATDGLNIDVDRLPSGGTSTGIVGSVPVGLVDIDINFTYGRYSISEKIPFRVSMDESKDPPFSLLGRDPFL